MGWEGGGVVCDPHDEMKVVTMRGVPRLIKYPTKSKKQFCFDFQKMDISKDGYAIPDNVFEILYF